MRQKLGKKLFHTIFLAFQCFFEDEEFSSKGLNQKAARIVRMPQVASDGSYVETLIEERA